MVSSPCCLFFRHTTFCLRFVLVISRWCVFFLVSGETMRSRDSRSWRLVSRWCMSSGVLAGGLAGTDCSSTSFAVAKGMCPFLLWLQLALRAEGVPSRHTAYRRVARLICQRGRVRTHCSLTTGVCALVRQTSHHQPLLRRR